MLLVKRDVSVWHEAQVLTLALLTSCEYSWAMNELQRGHIQVRACRRGWLYWTILSHFCLTCESFSSPCWFWPPACQLNCSEHGRCDSFTKRCVCDPFWMENFLRVQMGDGESNCGTWTPPRVETLAEKPHHKQLVLETQGGHSARHLLSLSCSDEMLTAGHSPLSRLLGRWCLIGEWVPFRPSQWTLTKSWVHSGYVNHSSLLSCLYRGFPVTGKQVW